MCLKKSFHKNLKPAAFSLKERASYLCAFVCCLHRSAPRSFSDAKKGKADKAPFIRWLRKAESEGCRLITVHDFKNSTALWAKVSALSSSRKIITTEWRKISLSSAKIALKYSHRNKTEAVRLV